MKIIPALIVGAAVTVGGANAQTVLTRTLAEELDRNLQILKQKTDPKPYFMSYEVTDVESDSIIAAHGSVDSQNHNRTRSLDVTVHVGSPEFDNYKKVLNVRPPRFTAGSPFTLDDSPAAIRQLAWQQTDGVYKAAAQRLTRIKRSEEHTSELQSH